MTSFSIHGGIVRLADLAYQTDTIESLEATDVHFIGPGVIANAGGEWSIQHLAITPHAGGIDALLWEIGTRSALIGAIGIRHATLIRCRFTNVGVAGRSDFLNGFAQLASFE